ncbi:MAG: phosphoenolpyruvate synthase, partial [Clostridiales Family XIII bacterium]|nr:phosphoenolpyruvate synthase [Clostridiales Family XIII bacterium]
MINQKKAPSGLGGLDRAVDDIRYGDNVVWQISDPEEYAFFAEPFAEISIRDRKNTVYLRYGKDAPLLKPVYGLKIVELDPAAGFEAVVMHIHDIIEREGDETHYIFDSMTALQREWIADFMLSNFFTVVASDIVKHKCVAYYAFTRNLHSIEAVARIREAAQLLLDVFHAGGNMYLYPLRVTERYHFSMFLPHKVDKDDANKIEPLTNGI